MIATEVNQNVMLANGSFTPSEANDLALAMIDAQINWHKLQRLGMQICNDNADTDKHCSRIAALEAERKAVRERMREARHMGTNLSISTTLKIGFEE